MHSTDIIQWLLVAAGSWKRACDAAVCAGKGVNTLSSETVIFHVFLNPEHNSSMSQQGCREGAAGVPLLRPHGMCRRHGLSAGSRGVRRQIHALRSSPCAMLRVREQGPPLLRSAAGRYVQVIIHYHGQKLLDSNRGLFPHVMHPSCT